MQRTRSERDLARNQYVVADTTDDDQPSADQIAIAIPGIRTDGTWVDSVSARSRQWARPIQILKLGSPDRISSLALVTRFGLAKTREALRTDLANTVIKYQGTHSISVICHSMGASLFSELLDDLDCKFDMIIFLGSLCRRSEALKIQKHCKTFINHCGTRDRWPVVAETLNPWSYSSTGTIGFKKPYAQDLFFENDHITCTQQLHMDTYVIPQLYGTIIEVPVNVTHIYSSTIIKYWRFWGLSAFAIGLLTLSLIGFLISRLVGLL